MFNINLESSISMDIFMKPSKELSDNEYNCLRLWIENPNLLVIASELQISPKNIQIFLVNACNKILNQVKVSTN